MFQNNISRIKTKEVFQSKQNKTVGIKALWWE